MTVTDSHPARWRQFFHRSGNLLVVLTGVLVAVLGLVLPILPGERAVGLRLGDVASQDVLAPRSIVFVSQVLTRQAQDQAALLVSPVYDPPDRRITQQQLESLTAALAYISDTRSNTFSTPQQKLADLARLDEVRLPTETAGRILQLSDLEWELVQNEATTLLDQVLRQQIRPDRVEDVRRSLPAYISLTMPESQATLVVELVRGLIVFNSLYNEAETKRLQAEAAGAVLPVTRSFVAGQVVVSRGQIVTAADMEAVESLGLTTGSLNWRSAGSMTLAAVMIALLLILFLRQYHPEVGRTFRLLLLETLLFVLFVAGARVMIPGHAVLPYIFPFAALAVTNSIFIGPGYGMLSGLLLAVLAGLLGGNQLEITLYGGLGSLAAVLATGHGEKPFRFFAAGLAAFAVGAVVVVIVRMREPASDLAGVLMLTGASLANGLLTGSLALGILFVAGGIFDLTTNLHLLELSRPDHPLLRILLRDAPGTYQHSLQVANLAEAAGERIGANTLLLRVGALFHDSGKAMRPKFFVENQGPEGNPHDRLDPETSAKLIIQHTRDGLDLARKYRLPTQVRNLIPEHHGTLRTNYQFGMAVKAAGEGAVVDEKPFHYFGPRPQSKEAAILMLADGVEAKFRALRPGSSEEIDTLVRTVVDERIAQRQFDETELTLRDLDQIRQALADTLRGSIHPRLLYPEDEEKAPDAKPTRV